MSPEESRQAEVIEKLAKENERLRAEVERLRKALEEALRRLKRQAAPFSKDRRKEDPKRPGRKVGLEYGSRAFRAAPGHIDEVISVPLPETCDCGWRIVHDDRRPQFQEEIVRKTIVRRFDVEIGHCAGCGKRFQGHHPLQTSDALGAAKVQIGPEALSLAVHLNKQMGISHERVSEILGYGYGVKVSRSALCRAIARLADKAQPTYEALSVAVRSSWMNWLDETGWRVAAQLRWLWVVRSVEVTVYAILPGRGYEQAAGILGEDYEGFLIHDGWQPYYRFPDAFHQTCLSHLIRRCQDMVETASAAAARFPLAVLRLLQGGLKLRDRFFQHEITEHGLRVTTGRLQAAMGRLLSTTYRDAANRRLAKHLRHERPWLFTFLHCPGIDATNNAAERALRPAVVARKTWGGNRTETGASTQQILMSVLQTCHQQGKDSFERIVELWRSPEPIILDIVPVGGSP
jgi:transposase